MHATHVVVKYRALGDELVYISETGLTLETFSTRTEVQGDLEITYRVSVKDKMQEAHTALFQSMPVLGPSPR